MRINWVQPIAVISMNLLIRERKFEMYAQEEIAISATSLSEFVMIH